MTVPEIVELKKEKKMKVYVVLDVNGTVQHELVEVWSTEKLAEARVLYLNARAGAGECWCWKEEEVRGA
jgi:hypothetical protein